MVYATFLLPVVHIPSFISLLLLLPSCRHGLIPSRQTHTRIDLTISAIQPPKSNYHGHNTVIKSNGLSDEAPTQRQKRSFSSLLHIIPSVPSPGTMNRVHSSPRTLCISTFIFLHHTLNILQKVDQVHIYSGATFSLCLWGISLSSPVCSH